MAYVDARAAAIQAAATLHADMFADLINFSDRGTALRKVMDTGDDILSWILGATTITLTPGPVTSQETGFPTGTLSGGNPMQVHDNEQFTVTVAATDSKGVPVSDNLTFTTSDPNVFTVQPGADAMSALVVAGLPGSGTLTVTDGTLTATLAVDVVAGGVALLTLSEGPVEPQPTPPPAPEPTPAP